MRIGWFYLIMEVRSSTSIDQVVDVETNSKIANAIKLWYEKRNPEYSYYIAKWKHEDHKTLEWLFSNELKELKEGK